jgi:hypothetical protein
MRKGGVISLVALMALVLLGASSTWLLLSPNRPVRKGVLVVLFIPSVERDGTTPIKQEFWVQKALDTLGQLYGGATAFPRAQGVWRDDARGGVLVKDQPVVIHCYTTSADIADPDRLSQLKEFCRKMGRETHQGEVGLVIGDEYLAFRDF